MPLNNADDILRSLHALAEQQPAQDATARALEATRATILQTQTSRAKRRRILRRITLLSGMAACVIAAAMLALFVQTNARASTAQQFREVVQAAQAKPGWVHLATVQISTASGIPSAGSQMRITYHSNAAEGLLGEVREAAAGGEKEMRFYAFNQRQVSSYSTRTGVIHLALLEAQEARRIAQGLMLPASIGSTLAKVKTSVGHDPVSIQKKREGHDSCYEVELFGSEKEEREFHETNERGGGGGAGAANMSHMAIWVNDDKVMTRVACNGPKGAITGDVTYGPPEIRSIYDLGVPRDAKIVDDRSQTRDRD